MCVRFCVFLESDRFLACWASIDGEGLSHPEESSGHVEALAAHFQVQLFHSLNEVPALDVVGGIHPARPARLNDSFSIFQSRLPMATRWNTLIHAAHLPSLSQHAIVITPSIPLLLDAENLVLEFKKPTASPLC